MTITKKSLRVSKQVHMRMLRWHRYLALLFSVPIFILIFTGAILATIPLLRDYPGPPPLEQVKAAVTKFEQVPYQYLMFRNDIGEARLVSMSAAGMSMDSASLYSGELIEAKPMERFYVIVRHIHKTFLSDHQWLVELSTWALLVVLLSGAIIVTRYRRRTTMIGWHYGLAVVVLVPLLAMTVSSLVMLQKHKQLKATPTAMAANASSVMGKSQSESVALDVDQLFTVLTQHNAKTISSIQKSNGDYSVTFVDQDGLAKRYDGDAMTTLPPSTGKFWSEVHLGSWGGVASIGLYAACSYSAVLLFILAFVVLFKRSYKRWRAKRSRLARVPVS
ncbi:PepSY-associated TM helix domain-containing protein [Ferrimonas lipolytica]|uniref:PepSY domain-containing protein n=1 Tax=Ferrimonas lipolytica TaxID=2724191 RepID=A0A6H1UCZ3_9GAMM|nr:PepSY-associated TM helix domain-containing protein [Ferrimonas lipolytica]QIZ76223.1 PepSY domain-containing protein [Ferrimonas lipolytica]